MVEVDDNLIANNAPLLIEIGTSKQADSLPVGGFLPKSRTRLAGLRFGGDFLEPLGFQAVAIRANLPYIAAILNEEMVHDFPIYGGCIGRLWLW